MTDYVKSLEEQNEELKQKLSALEEWREDFRPFWINHWFDTNIANANEKQIRRKEYGTTFYRIALVEYTIHKNWAVKFERCEFYLPPYNGGIANKFFNKIEDAEKYVVETVDKLKFAQRAEIEYRKNPKVKPPC